MQSVLIEGEEPKNLFESLMEIICNRVFEDGSCRCVISGEEKTRLEKSMHSLVDERYILLDELVKIVDSSSKENILLKNIFFDGLAEMGIIVSENDFLGTAYLVYTIAPTGIATNCLSRSGFPSTKFLVRHPRHRRWLDKLGRLKGDLPDLSFLLVN